LRYSAETINPAGITPKLSTDNYLVFAVNFCLVEGFIGAFEGA
jgi:hypothetical protein